MRKDRLTEEQIVGVLRGHEADASLADAHQIIKTWRQDYDQVRPHSSLDYHAPVKAFYHIIGAYTLIDVDGFS